MPWYLFDGEAHAQEGIEIDHSSPENIADLAPSLPGPCSDEHVCLLVRLATVNKIIRSRQITIEKLQGNPVLFIGTERASFKRKASQNGLHDRSDSQIFNADPNLLSEKRAIKKKRRKVTKAMKGRGRNQLINASQVDMNFRTM